MSFNNFFTGNGELTVKDKFVSVRLIQEALEGVFRIDVIEESPSSIKYKIVRFARIYGAPVIWPNASLAIMIDNKTDTIKYRFHWPDYYMLFLLPVVVLLSPGSLLKENFLLPFLAVLFWAGLIFLDTKYVSSKVRKALLKLSTT